MDVDKIGGTFVVTNDMLEDLPTYVIVDELPKQGETDKRYIIKGKNDYKVYCWRTDGYDLIDAVDTQGWITDRPPEVGSTVLITHNVGAYSKIYEVDSAYVSLAADKERVGFEDTGYGEMWYGIWGEDVIAWMPLPKPYEIVG